MHKTEVIAELAKKTGKSNKDTADMVNALLDLITEKLKAGEKITLTGFGTFEARARAARTGTDIRTKKKISIPAGIRPAFSAGAELKAAVEKSK